ncbi:TIGR02301 family protein [Pseudohoeflea coraliihabitans]|nr:TIGR02301 family protein [Pseudohoeflea sp. DP4N28-3]
MVALLLLLAPAATPAAAQSAPPGAAQIDDSGTPPYENKLLRLSEILGSLQYLRTLCNDAERPIWRGFMARLLDREAGEEEQRRAQLTAAYNRGFRTFASVHANCSQAARMAESRYHREGETLTAEIIARYGN